MDLAARPHDLLWLRNRCSLQGVKARWLDACWHNGLPVVVRRDVHVNGLIAVGIRGIKRSQRAAAWVDPSQVVMQVTPEELAEIHLLNCSPFVAMPPVQAAIQLLQQKWPWSLGITGSTGYALATGILVLHPESDLDITIRAPQVLQVEAVGRWQQLLSRLPCRVDTQVETPYGAFSLNEWLRDKRVLLKTNQGPRLVSYPWQWEDNQHENLINLSRPRNAAPRDVAFIT